MDEPGMFKFMKRWEEDESVGWPAVGKKRLDWVDSLAWEALQARVRIIHGGIGSDGYTGQRKQDGTPDKRTRVTHEELCLVSSSTIASACRSVVVHPVPLSL